MSKKNEYAAMDLLTAFHSESQASSNLKVSEIQLNPNQPRVFDRNKVDDLKESMKRLGMIEPIIVRRESSKFIIVAGERRYRAAQSLGWEEVPVKIVDDSPDICYEMSLAENEKRKSLNPWEVGKAIQFLRKEKKKTASEVASILGYTERYIKQLTSIARLDQSTVENMISLGKEPSVKNLENMLKLKEGRGGEMISPEENTKKVRITLNLDSLNQKKKELFLKELNALKKKYGLI
ncbi:MAG: ParB/RepB/Spo0J family partition protein [Leptospiraceae bacterium]|nr:ParB/RepB/Spo0J family partition protein [Leptospiraceae bacterium]MCP5511080.1 ParB/RepB/Spo0J family partition protein [Leptospiraceae bacterium]